MRHSRIDLTMNVYTDPKLLDIHGAVDALPTLAATESMREILAATGTDGEPETTGTALSGGQWNRGPRAARTVAPTTVKVCQNMASSGGVDAASKNGPEGSRHEKTPENTVFFGVFASDADGARTRNHRIDSPVL